MVTRPRSSSSRPLSPSCSCYLSLHQRTLLSALLFSTGVWLSGIWLCRQVLKLLLSYHGWMFEPHGKISFSTKAWVVRPRGSEAGPSLTPTPPALFCGHWPSSRSPQQQARGLGRGPEPESVGATPGRAALPFPA